MYMQYIILCGGRQMMVGRGIMYGTASRMAASGDGESAMVAKNRVA